MHRTPPRRSPRFQSEANAMSDLNTTILVDSETDVTVGITEVPSTNAAAENVFQNYSRPVAEPWENALNSMQRQISALQNQLSHAEAQLKERDLQYQTLQQHIMSHPASTNSTTSLTTNAVTFSSAATVSNVATVRSSANLRDVTTSIANAFTVTTSATIMSVAQPTQSATYGNYMPLYPNTTKVNPPFQYPSIGSDHFIPPTNQNYAESIFGRPPIGSSSFSPHIMPPGNNSPWSGAMIQPRKIQDLPDFSGRAEDWPMFFTAFTQSTAAYGYTNFENNQRLQKCLKGDARETVKSLLIHPDNVRAIVEQLRFRFGRPAQLIRSQLLEVREFAPIPENAQPKIISFATKTKNLAVFLQSLNADQHLANPTLLEELVAKLPMSKRIEWATYASRLQPYATVVHFSTWLNHIASLICTVQDVDVREPKRRMVLHATKEPSFTASTCPICKHQHKAMDCKRLIQATVAEGWSQAKQSRLCFSCLNAGHLTRDCRVRKLCSIDGCKKIHHKLLHEVNAARNTSTNNIQNQDDIRKTENTVLSCSGDLRSSTLLFRMLPVTLYSNSKTIDTYALLDEGSSITMLDNTLIEELGLQGQQHNLNVQWFGGRSAREPTVVVDLQISGTGMKKKHKLHNVYGISGLNLPIQTLSERELQHVSKQARCLPIKPFYHVAPKLLIGLDHCHLGLPSETFKINNIGPYAAKTELGWVVYGPTRNETLEFEKCLHISDPSERELHDMIADFFSTETFGVKSSPIIENAEDVYARTILQSTIKRVDGGRFEAGLLWKSDDVKLPDSYAMAFKRLLTVERKMKRDQLFAKAYMTIIDSYVEKNYARKLQPVEAAKTGPRTWYLPHFGVVNPNKPAKLRFVFDAAAKVNGISLNSQLLKGPQEYRSLTSILFHFREGAVAVCGDIKEMFHQVLIRKEDRCAQRFLWRGGDENKEPEIYEMIAMTFGAVCSPCIANYVKIQNALEFRNEAARAVKSIKEYHYVDDFVDSFDSLDEAIVVSKQVRDIHMNAGFELRNFSSSHSEVLSALGGSEKTLMITSKDNLTTEKILGMHWQSSSDNFCFKLKFNYVDNEVIAGLRCPTKREFLSVVMSIFDPLGFHSHFTIAGKLILRELWKRKLRWDEHLPGDVSIAWEKWRKQLFIKAGLKIPRFYFRDGYPNDLQLHVFVDASEDAFAAAAYWRSRNAEGSIEVSLVWAKARGAPLKSLTIPRLELQAAVLGTRLMKTIHEYHTVQISKSILWSDSKTVLKWIKSEHRRYKPFVAHRVSEILEDTLPSNWRWIPTNENVADEATRFGSSFDASSTARWLNGPEFLRYDEHQWPCEDINCNSEEEEEELRPKFALLTIKNDFIEFNRFSNLSKLIRATAWVIRFINNCRRRCQLYQDFGLTSIELQAAEKINCCQAQAEGFATEIAQIYDSKAVSRNSSIYKLSPYIDDDGLLRMQGRIDAACWLSYDTQRPIILPTEHEFTKLMVKQQHHMMKHQNFEATICEIRRKYWVPRLRQLLRKVTNSCFCCKIKKALPITPLMGPLPKDRLTPYVRPFSFTGLDYFGPMLVTIGRRKEKRWVALFTCLTVRAVHLEITHDLSTDACILAIRNFINRRGVPVRIRTDNGKNFIGANQEAKRFSEVFDCDHVQKELSSRGVEWIFNCPQNPSAGGAWERMIQCIKRVLRHTLNEIAPREHTLQSLLIEAENIVNSRPLTHIPITADQDEPLTPNHFLLGSANTGKSPSINNIKENVFAVRKQWRIARQLKDRFWKRWISEYLPTLTRRVKWCQPTKPLAVGDIVFVCDSNIPRREWCRGNVEKVFPGSDGVIRRADVRTLKGLIRRPVSKLAVLDLDVSETDCFTGEGML